MTLKGSYPSWETPWKWTGAHARAQFECACPVYTNLSTPCNPVYNPEGYCLGTLCTLEGYCLGTLCTLQWYCLGTLCTLQWYCLGTLCTLQWYCLGIPGTLWWRILLGYFWYTRDTVRALLVHSLQANFLRAPPVHYRHTSCALLHYNKNLMVNGQWQNNNQAGNTTQSSSPQ